MDPLASTYDTNMIPWVVLTVLAGIVIVIFAWCIYAFLNSAIRFIFSQGDTAKQQKARDGLQYMIIWLILCLLFLFAFPVLFKRARVEGYEYYTPRNVFIRVSELTKEMFSITDIVKNGYPQSKIFAQPVDDQWNALDVEL